MHMMAPSSVHLHKAKLQQAGMVVQGPAHSTLWWTAGRASPGLPYKLQGSLVWPHRGCHLAQAMEVPTVKVGLLLPVWACHALPICHALVSYNLSICNGLVSAIWSITLLVAALPPFGTSHAWTLMPCHLLHHLAVASCIPARCRN